MNFESSRHCKIMRSIGAPLGLWPFRRTLLGTINGALAVTIIVLGIAAQLHNDLSGTVKGVFNSGGYLQLAVFTTHEFSLDLFLKIVIGMVPCVFYVVKYYFFMRNMDQVKYAFEWIQCNYDSLTNERELRLIEKLADRGTSIIKSIFYCLMFMILPITFPILAALLNLEAAVNQSRSVLIPYKAEIFVDQDRYFYWIMLHINATAILGISILFVTESTFVHFTTHACGLLEVVGDRVERVLESSVPNALCGETYLSIHGLVAAIKLHQRVLEFIEYMNSTFMPHYCVLIGIGVFSISVNLYTVARAMVLRKVTNELLIALILVIGQFVYMGCGNYVSQILIDKGDELFTKTYYARWHESPVPVQKMLLYMRQRSMLPTELVFGGLYTCSLEFYSKLVNTSMSYFTILYSTA